MGNALRSIMATTGVLLLGSGTLRGRDMDLSVGIGTAAPSGGLKRWVGSGVGPSLDIMESFDLNSGDFLRLRLGYFAFKARGNAAQTLALPESAGADYPADTSNQVFGFTYGAEYLYLFRPKVYLLGGGGVEYLQATRLGSIDLTSSGQGVAPFRYSAVSLVPYLCAGLGWRFNPHLAFEGRYQYSSLKNQTRGVDLRKQGFSAPGTAIVPGFSAPTATLGLLFYF
jgi:hypothetical protein